MDLQSPLETPMGPGELRNGGGLYHNASTMGDTSSPRISHCTFKSNFALTVTGNCSNGTMHLVVSDTGIGMTKSQTKRLLNGLSLDRRLGTTGERSTGLGLTLVKDLIDQNKGSIHVYSEPDRGTTFELSLPREAKLPK
ncbi:MAG: ATP-binding protein [Saprospiraceae bacterium]|nr:ATP-binding protein [Saprospiraceae bacterium]